MRSVQSLLVFGVVGPLLLLAGCGDDPAPPTDRTTAKPHATASGSEAARSENETPTPEVKVRLEVLEKLNVPLDLRWRMQFPVVSGLPDRSVEQRINQRLRAVPEDVLDGWEQTIADSRASLPPPAHRTHLRTDARLGLRGPRLLSVQYTFETNATELGRSVGEPVVFLTLDLETGRELTASDLLSDRVGTPDGASAFGRLLAEFGPGGRLCDQDVTGTRDLRPEDILSEDPNVSAVSVFPTADDVRFSLRLWNLGYPMSCGSQTITVGYDDLRGFLSPELAQG